MPAIFDDPDAAPIPAPLLYHASFSPRQVVLRDRVTTATIIPYSSAKDVPPSLLAYLSDQFNKEIELGDTYPMTNTMSVETFANYWFQNFGAVMFLGNIERAEDIIEGTDFSKQCLGSYYIKPNYPGRSSHICNAGFLVTDAARARGVGRLLGESYIDWAPRLGYTYSVFNLVYETNVASCKIWDALGFKRVGRVKGAGNLRSYPNQLVDAIIFGRDLGPDSEDFVSEERFDKIKFYLKFGKYPNGSDRAEKSRLRSAATHYKLIDGEKLMLKGKEVVSDPSVQYEIAKNVHNEEHAGINKCTQSVSAQYHWVRIKETVSLVIKNCKTCKEVAKEKTPLAVKDNINPSRRRPENGHIQPLPGVSTTNNFNNQPVHNGIQEDHSTHAPYQHLGQHIIPDQLTHHHQEQHRRQQQQQLTSQPHIQHLTDYNAIDPQIMKDVQTYLNPHLDIYNQSSQPPPNLQSQPQIQQQQHNISHPNPLLHNLSHAQLRRPHTSTLGINNVNDINGHNHNHYHNHTENEHEINHENQATEQDLNMLLEEENDNDDETESQQRTTQNHCDERDHSRIGGGDDMILAVEEALRRSDDCNGGGGSDGSSDGRAMMGMFEHEFRRR